MGSSTPLSRPLYPPKCGPLWASFFILSPLCFRPPAAPDSSQFNQSINQSIRQSNQPAPAPEASALVPDAKRKGNKHRAQGRNPLRPPCSQRGARLGLAEVDFASCRNLYITSYRSIGLSASVRNYPYRHQRRTKISVHVLRGPNCLDPRRYTAQSAVEQTDSACSSLTDPINHLQTASVANPPPPSSSAALTSALRSVSSSSPSRPSAAARPAIHHGLEHCRRRDGGRRVQEAATPVR